MIRVLQSLDEVERAISALPKKGLSLHGDPVKNWDLIQIDEILEEYEGDIHILDMGCGGTACSVLKFLCNRGLTNCYGIDLSISIEDRLTQIWSMIKNKRIRSPFKLMRGDLTRTQFLSNSFDFIICLSVIEHGVNVESFLEEAGRLLRSQGTLFVSTDYWEPKILTNDSGNPLGLDWNIFSKKEIESLIDKARKHNLRLKSEANIPLPKDKVIHWNGKEYTAISLVFKKE